MKADKQATEARHFLDPCSFVFKDGREWLVGKDWEARKFELLKRCGGRCEHIFELESLKVESHLRCVSAAEHPHHKIKRSVARDDRLANLEGLCWYHHQQAHPEKQLMKCKGASMSDKPKQFITGLFRVVAVPVFASDLKPGSYQMELLADVEPIVEPEKKESDKESG